MSKYIICRFVPTQVEKNVIDILSQTLKIRKNNNLVHHDFLHVMNQIQENSKSVEFTEVDVTTHALGGLQNELDWMPL